MDDCLFCKIINGEIPSTKVYEDDTVYAFNDIEPQAPIHIIIVPKAHIASANELDDNNAAVVGHIFAVAAKLADEMGFAKEVADRVLFVDGGLILEDGSPSQVFDAPTSDRTKLFLSKIL